MIYDITQELFGSVVYPGNTTPVAIQVKSMENGATANLTDLHMCTHNGTHMDAPLHFVRDGKSIDELDPESFIGPCQVISPKDREKILASDCARILLKGCERIDEELALRLVDKGIKLVGVEGQSVGNQVVHRILLSHEIIVLEGIRLSEVPEGTYLLLAAPLKLGGCEGAPCRVFLIDGVS